MKRIGTRVGLVVGLWLASTSYLMAEKEQGLLTLTDTVFQKIEQQGSQTVRKNMPITEAKPGEELSYVLTYSNEGDQPVKESVMTSSVPEGLEYISTSILKNGETDASFEVSVDGGIQYGSLAHLTVPVEGDKPRRAKAKDVTHVRWLLKSSMAPEEDLYIFIRGRVTADITPTLKKSD